MREDNGDQAHRVFDISTTDLDFDDFHPYPLTFRDALSTHDVPHLSRVSTSVVPIDLDFRHEEVSRRDKNADSGNVSAEGAESEVLSTSGYEAGGSEVRGSCG